MSASGKVHVQICMAMTADGKIASANRHITQFGSRADHERMMALRDKADAILTGAGTLNAQPEIRLRANAKPKAPLRVIASGSGQVNPAHGVFESTGAPVVVLSTERISRPRAKALREAAHTLKICGVNAIDFPTALDWLHNDWGVKRIVCEGGGRLNDSLLRAGVVDEVHLTICSLILGGREAPTISDGVGFSTLEDAAQFRLHTRKLVGEEMFLVYRRAANA